ncbi:MAG: ABC transporter permease [Bacillota bacterium]|nr:ABC transporter permease [Bacillota bacterium]
MRPLASQPDNSRKEPFIRITKRADISRRNAALIRSAAVVLALFTGALLIITLGHNPFYVYADMLKGALGTKTVFKETVKTAVPLLSAAIAVALAFRMRFWNIGAEGQILAGAMGAAYFALFQYKSMPHWLLLIVMCIAAIVAGGIWGLIPAFFKAKWDTNETLFTLMLNYIALGIEQYLQNGPWKNPRSGFPKISMFTAEAKLPKLFGVHIGWVLAILLAAAAYIYLTHSKQGFETAVVGESTNTARYAGMNVSKIIIRTMFISGAIAGITGFMQVSGSDFTLTENTAGGVGFTAITVAWLSKLNPIIMIFVSFALAILEKGANRIQTTFKIPASAAEVLTGVILFFMLGCEFFINYRLVFKGRKERSNG